MTDRSSVLVAAIAVLLLVHARPASANGAILVLGKAPPQRHELIVDSVKRVGQASVCGRCIVRKIEPCQPARRPGTRARHGGLQQLSSLAVRRVL